MMGTKIQSLKIFFYGQFDDSSRDEIFVPISLASDGHFGVMASIIELTASELWAGGRIRRTVGRPKEGFGL